MRPDPDKPYYTAYDKRYQEVYRQGVTYWTSSPDELNSITESVDAFIDRNAIPNDAYILDVGCGEGGLGVYLLEKGYAYTGIDVSPTAVERATERISEYGNRGRIMLMDARDPGAIVVEVYDAVIDIACLPTLVVDLHRQQYLQHLWRMLKIGAPALFSRQAFDPNHPTSISTVMKHGSPSAVRKSICPSFKMPGKMIVLIRSSFQISQPDHAH